ncbi:unnamed protein product [Anisakis simplex]|uniref:Zf-CHCC domain-containing protein n=1 Tax=Anisakis simplex TaxID=6269 RepID=A0A0M3J9K4_ANISI|nr:unnamed protein product [Anisakis simplex]
MLLNLMKHSAAVASSFRLRLANNLHRSASCSVKKISIETVGDTTTVQLVDVPDPDQRKVLKKSDDTCSLCTCNIPVKVEKNFFEFHEILTD